MDILNYCLRFFNPIQWTEDVKNRDGRKWCVAIQPTASRFITGSRSQSIPFLPSAGGMAKPSATTAIGRSIGKPETEILP